MKKILFATGGILLCGAVAAAYATSRLGYESAPYEVLLSDGKFEIRKYPPLLVAGAPMEGGMNMGFRRLFNYISGKNSTGEKIAMTTPVYVEQKEQDRTMSFVMPASFSLEDLPKANDPSVAISEMPGGIFAVLRFSGSRNSESEERVLQQLKGEMTARGLPVQSGPVYAYFDPPWIPPFLRRNEVMIRTKK
jgi:DNA gyrase inhibitor GyrI